MPHRGQVGLQRPAFGVLEGIVPLGAVRCSQP